MSGYNGYSNYQTWAVDLWLNNDQGTYDYWYNRAVELRGDVYALAQELDDLLEELVENSDLENGMLLDLLNSAISDVSAFEIAEGFIDAAGAEIAEALAEDDDAEDDDNNDPF